MASHCWISSDSDDSLPPVPHFIKSTSNSKTHIELFKGDNVILTSNNGVEISSEKHIVDSSDSGFCGKSVTSELTEKKNKSKNTYQSNSLLKASLSPEQIIKDMRCSISCMVEKLFSGDRSSFLDGFTDSTSIYQMVDLPTPVIEWKYEPPAHNAEILIPNQVLIAIDAKDLLKFLESSIGISQFASWVHSCTGTCSLLYVACVRLNGFKYKLQKKSKKADGFNGEQLVNLKENLDQFFVVLQVSYGINVIHIENRSEFILLLSQLTQAISQAPLKKKRKENIKFINQNASVKIDSSSGKGASSAWKQMLQQMFNVSAEVASAITSRYDTPRKLISAYQTLPKASAALLLADLQVRRGVGSLQTVRRLGPELSKRIFKLFTCQDGREVL